MRGILLSVVLAGAFAIAAPTTRAAAAVTAAPTMSAATAPVYALQVPDKQIEITVNDRGGVRWYRNPIWIALAAFGGVIILLLDRLSPCAAVARRSSRSRGSGLGTSRWIRASCCPIRNLRGEAGSKLSQGGWPCRLAASSRFCRRSFTPRSSRRFSLLNFCRSVRCRYRAPCSRSAMRYRCSSMTFRCRLRHEAVPAPSEGTSPAVAPIEAPADIAPERDVSERRSRVTTRSVCTAWKPESSAASICRATACRSNRRRHRRYRENRSGFMPACRHRGRSSTCRRAIPRIAQRRELKASWCSTR